MVYILTRRVFIGKYLEIELTNFLSKEEFGSATRKSFNATMNTLIDATKRDTLFAEHRCEPTLII